jgi:hypothetical protein
MHSARQVGIASLIVFAAGFFLPQLFFQNQDPAGKGMMTGLLAFVFWAAAIILGIVAFVGSFRGNPDVVTKILGRAPVFVIVVVIAAAVVTAINS